MKHFILYLLTSFLFVAHTTYAQREYWGLASQGGKNFVFTPQVGITNYGSGVIFKTDKYGHNQQVAYNFDSATGCKPIGSLTQAGNGKLYGFATVGGGATDTMGCFFEFDPITYHYRIIKKFLFPGFVQGNNISYNGGKPLLASNGKIYGLNYTGAWTCRIFEYDPTTDVYIDKYTFNQTNFLRPLYGFNRLMQASNGKIYITFRDGCSLSYFHTGQLYEYNPFNNAVSLLNSYPNTDGSAPGGAFMEYSPGIMYNTFCNGNNRNLAMGGIHKYDIASNTISIVARFDTVTGNAVGANCTLVQAGNKLYGATYGGGAYGPNGSGIIFEFDPANNSLKRLYDFNQFAYPDSLLDSISPGMIYSDYRGWGNELLLSHDTLWGLTEQSMYYYVISTGEFKSLFGLTSYKGTNPQWSTLTQTCIKPYYKLPAQDTFHVPLATSFSYNIQSHNSTGFQWIKEGTNIGDTDSILNFSAFSMNDTGWYTCKLSNECGDTITKAIYLTAHILPVSLLSFTAIIQNENALVQWKTAQEVNNDYFNVQRSSNGVDFLTVGKVKGHGTTSLPYNYHYTDKATPRGISYYRLQQVDYDGKLTYSNIEMINKTANADFTITPNPANDKVLLRFNKTEPIAKLEWINANGQIVQTNEYKNIRQQSITINHLSAGVYTLRVTIKNSTENRQLVVEHS